LFHLGQERASMRSAHTCATGAAIWTCKCVVTGASSWMDPLAASRFNASSEAPHPTTASVLDKSNTALNDFCTLSPRSYWIAYQSGRAQKNHPEDDSF
jgi:hypothetical protein